MISYCILISHIIGCLWNLLAQHQITYNLSEKTWLHHQKLEKRSLSEKYVTSIYWAIVTMLTVGYGDVIPISIYEKIFAMFTLFLACIIFAYSMNVIGNILNSMEAEDNLLKFNNIIINKKFLITKFFLFLKNILKVLKKNHF